MRNTTPVGGQVEPPTDAAVEQPAGELAELRAENAANRAALESLQAQVMAMDARRAPVTPSSQPQSAAKRRLVRRRPNRSGGPDETPTRVSRRRLFGLLGGAAAVGTSLAVVGSALTSDPAGATPVTAGAADGDALQIGGANINTPGSSQATKLTGSTNALSLFQVEQTEADQAGAGIVGLNSSNVAGAVGVGGSIVTGSATGMVGVFGTAGSTDGIGVAGWGQSTNGIGVKALSTSGAQLLIVDNSVTMPPTSGAWTVGSLVVSEGQLWFCTRGGNGGAVGIAAPIFVLLSSPLVGVSPPARVYDSRTSDGPLSTGNQRDVTVAGGPSVPSGVSAILCNVTCASPSGSGYLAIFEQGTIWSGTSNINFTNGQDIANNATSSVSSTGKVTMLCGGPGSTQFVIDVFGYYG